MTPKTGTWILAAAVVTVIGGIGVNQAYDKGHVRWGWLAAAVLVTAIGGYVALRLNRPTGADATVEPAVAQERALDALADTVEKVWEPEERAQARPRCCYV